MCHLYFLKMSKSINHRIEKWSDLLFIKGLFSLWQISFKICETFLHLYVTFFDSFSLSFLLNQSIRTSKIYNVRMRISFKFIQKLDFFKENKFVHFIFEYNFLNTLTFTLLTFHLINETVSMSDNMMLFKLFVQLFIPTYKFNVFWF